jgi:hypothetical protein
MSASASIFDTFRTAAPDSFVSPSKHTLSQQHVIVAHCLSKYKAALSAADVRMQEMRAELYTLYPDVAAMASKKEEMELFKLTEMKHYMKCYFLEQLTTHWGHVNTYIAAARIMREKPHAALGHPLLQDKIDAALEVFLQYRRQHGGALFERETIAQLYCEAIRELIASDVGATCVYTNWDPRFGEWALPEGTLDDVLHAAEQQDEAYARVVEERMRRFAASVAAAAAATAPVVSNAAVAPSTPPHLVQTEPPAMPETPHKRRAASEGENPTPKRSARKL